MKKNLVLLGMMGVGKTTLGKIVAKNQDLEFIDTDAFIEKKNSMSISKIFEKKGEKFFRTEEKKHILKLLKKNNSLIALGGGAFMNKDVREKILKNSISIWLDININTLNKRIKWNQKRPLLKKGSSLIKLDEIYAQRKDIYKLANFKIVCDNFSKSEISKKIIELYEKYKNHSQN